MNGILRIVAILGLQAIVCYGIYRALMRLRFVRREVRKFVRLSKQGPLYRLGSWLLRQTMRLVLGNKAYVAPTTPPKATHVRRTTETIVVDWRCTTSSRWVDDELQVEAVVDGDPAAVDIVGHVATLRGLAPGATVKLRARSSNRAGSSPWSRELEVTTLQRPKGGGGRGPGYTWKQTLRTVEVALGLPRTTRARDLDVKFTTLTLNVRLADLVVLDRARLHGPIRPDDSFWELADASTLLLTLEKGPRADDDVFWSCVIQGHPSIDTKLVSLSGDFDE